jgi:hypothetical protein
MLLIGPECGMDMDDVIVTEDDILEINLGISTLVDYALSQW